ncbi:MAG: right-handed parallel beta-helix repeat-containing protein [Planctomycetes bacterium]|nr:right-handed parallel beta-helix repeat-containing protein [Planctomycetota bacterium]
MNTIRAVWGLIAIVSVLATARPTVGATIYVDNRMGSDSFDGSSSTVAPGQMGPVRTIRQALKLARPGDTVVLANHGVPYYESVQLVGSRHSGMGLATGRQPDRDCPPDVIPFRLEGNGAIISGARPVPPGAWQRVGEDLWRFIPWRKGHYLLLKEGKPVPEETRLREPATLSALPAGRWCVWKGAIYYRAQPLELPSERRFEYAADGVGLTLYNVRFVHISNVTFRHFRLDGINAHDLCRCVVLENVTCEENGRAGLCVAGSSRVQVRNSRLVNNRKHSLLVTERAEAALEQVQLSQPPTLRE